MAGPKKQTPIEQIISVLKDLVTEPATDQSSLPPTAADVRRVKSEFRASTPRKKKSPKARARPASKKKRATTRKKTTRTKR